MLCRVIATLPRSSVSEGFVRNTKGEEETRADNKNSCEGHGRLVCPEMETSLMSWVHNSSTYVCLRYWQR